MQLNNKYSEIEKQNDTSYLTLLFRYATRKKFCFLVWFLERIYSKTKKKKLQTEQIVQSRGNHSLNEGIVNIQQENYCEVTHHVKEVFSFILFFNKFKKKKKKKKKNRK